MPGGRIRWNSLRHRGAPGSGSVSGVAVVRETGQERAMCFATSVLGDEGDIPHVANAAEQHAQLRASKPYQAQLRELASVTNGFVQALRVGWIAATRDPSSRNWLFWRFTDDLLASALGILQLVREGIQGPARRELRFMLELAIRNLYVDTVFASRETPLATRLAYVERGLGQEDVKLLSQMPLSLYLSNPAQFKRATTLLYGELSRFTHPTHDQLAQRLEQAEHGIYLGFETAAELESFNDLLRRTYDTLLVYLFEALGPDSTGDVFIQVLDERADWPFHATRFIPEVSRSFDYKHERSERRERTRHAGPEQ
jgi:hypothetical protein